ncbi:conserved hypothetical protein [Sphingomonas laterariae]|uniref:Porin n=1 Tax=Edaphosphingomonas laterariae TaxID=861865 RepID=A0A239FWN9_9SPHN|nr:TorF family putative porin [Sphingomonas laterariae]SNS60632.1 conserved hypothetical protein [Sphingomonas laterariae]
MSTLPRVGGLAVAIALIATAVPVQARPLAGTEISIEATTDLRRRGISWSDGKAALAANAYVPVAEGLEAGLGVASLRGSPRHDGADAVIDLDLGYRHISGPWSFGMRVAGHVFPGESGLGYAEAGAWAGLLIGPAQIDLSASYAPSQDAIGGDNLYLAARATVAVPGTPLTLVAGAGRSSGSVDDPVRAARLRPDGRYHDYHLGVDHVRGPLTLGVRYSDTTINADGDRGGDADARHAGSRLIARAAFTF